MSTFTRKQAISYATNRYMATCKSPPDVNVIGSVKVLIGGQPAGMCDTTAHGGVIVMGFLQVLIGG